jgi:putative DNA primase/helicase
VRINGSAIDIRTARGYIVLPGPNNGRVWLKPLTEPLAQVPVWVAPAPQHDTSPIATTGAAVEAISAQDRAWGQGALESEYQALCKLTSGRNQALNNAANKLGEIVAAKYLTREEVERRLETACVMNGYVEKDKWPAVHATIKSGLDAGIARGPRHPPPPKPVPIEIQEFGRPAVKPPPRASVSSVSDPSGCISSRGIREWPEPKPIPDGLTPVAPFDMDFLPESIAPWVADIADRMQCPPDFVAIPAIVALGAALGRKIGVRPQRRSDWTEVPNLWGCIIGRPGMMKSPAMAEALKPLHRLEKVAREAHAEAQAVHARDVEIFKLKSEAAREATRNAIKKGLDVGLPDLLEPEAPKARRYIVNDTTYEALGEILAGNPNGVLAFRDELVSLLKTLDREEYCAARGFFMSAWSGTTDYTFDRILRGKTHIEKPCLSLLGSTQPGRLAEYVRRAVIGGAGDDGLIQRFGLLVWPDQSGDWIECDRWPDTPAREAAWRAFDRLDSLDPDVVRAERDQFEALPFLRFDDLAQVEFSRWRDKLENRLRAADLAPALESHLAKYRKLVPALALIDHLADGARGSIGEKALGRALAFAEYLETHARRAYGAGLANETAVAKLILSRIRKGDLVDGFTARDIQRKQWSGLTDNEAIKAGLELLADFDWIAPQTLQTAGKPSVTYLINPREIR